MLVLGLGSNQPGRWGDTPDTLRAVLQDLMQSGITIQKTSCMYKTSPYGVRNQDVFVNAIAIAASRLPPLALLARLKEIERDAGRVRTRRWGPRVLDLDIIDYRGTIANWRGTLPLAHRRLVLPHAEAHKRVFVLKPLCDVAPFWHHPVFGATAFTLLRASTGHHAGSILENCGPL